MAKASLRSVLKAIRALSRKFKKVTSTMLRKKRRSPLRSKSSSKKAKTKRLSAKKRTPKTKRQQQTKRAEKFISKLQKGFAKDKSKMEDIFASARRMKEIRLSRQPPLQKMEESTDIPFAMPAQPTGIKRSRSTMYGKVNPPGHFDFDDIIDMPYQQKEKYA
jgi:hypothetical protein